MERQEPRTDGRGHLATEARAWLKKSGYPLEFRVARAFESQGFRVQPNHFVRMQADQKIREIDLLASIPRNTPFMRARFELYVECKSSRQLPWIFFDLGGSRPDAGTILRSFPSNSMGDALLWLLQDSKEIASTVPFSSSGPSVFNGRQAFDSEQRGQPDRFYATMQSVVGITRSAVAMKPITPEGLRQDDDPVFAFPVVVVDAPLLHATYDRDSDDIELAPINRARVLWRGAGDGDLTCVEVVHAQAVESFVLDCAAGLNEAFTPFLTAYCDVMKALKDNDPRMLKFWFHGLVLSPPILVPAVLRGLVTRYVDDRKWQEAELSY